MASLATILLIGVVVSMLSGAGSNYSAEAFRWAFTVQYPIWALGALQVVRYRRKARRAYGGQAMNHSGEPRPTGLPDQS